MTSGVYKRTKKCKEIASEGMKRAYKEGRAKINNNHFKEGNNPWNKGKNNPKIRGKKNGNWKGGTSGFGYPYEFLYKLRILIKERDNYTCQLCGVREGLVVHHKDKNKKNSQLNNLITLCRSCHTSLHNKGGEI